VSIKEQLKIVYEESEVMNRFVSEATSASKWTNCVAAERNLFQKSSVYSKVNCEASHRYLLGLGIFETTSVSRSDNPSRRSLNIEEATSASF
jgi:hypothetical protein